MVPTRHSITERSTTTSGAPTRAARHAVSAAAAAKVPAVYSWIRGTDLDGRLVRDAVARHPRRRGPAPRARSTAIRRRGRPGRVRDAHDGEARVGGVQHVGRKADRLEGTGPEALDDHIGPGRGVEQPARAVGGLEIDDRAPLPAVQVPEQPAAAVGIRPRHRRDRTPRAKRIAARAARPCRRRRRTRRGASSCTAPRSRRRARGRGARPTPPPPQRTPPISARRVLSPTRAVDLRAMVEQPRSDEIEDLGPAAVARRRHHVIGDFERVGARPPGPPRPPRPSSSSRSFGPSPMASTLVGSIPWRSQYFSTPTHFESPGGVTVHE